MKKTISPPLKTLAPRAAMARRRLAAAVSAVKITPEIEERLSKLAERAHKAKHAKFLDKYRVAKQTV